MLVCTEEQKKLIETIASWNENEDRNGDDQEAALLYLFFTSGTIFDPPDCPSGVTLTLKQLKNLKETLTYFLPRAEKFGFDQPVKHALDIVKHDIGLQTTRIERWKNNFKRYLGLLGESLSIFFLSWIFLSFKTAVITAIIVPYFWEISKYFFKKLVKYINFHNNQKISIILKRINYQEIKTLQKWAKNRLYERGILHKPKSKKEVDPETELRLRMLNEIMENSRLPDDVSEAYDKWYAC